MVFAGPDALRADPGGDHLHVELSDDLVGAEMCWH
jgi:hypothetical protein